MMHATTTSLESAREVAAAIEQVGLPKPSRGAMQAIANGCRPPFLESLRACLRANDPDGRHRRRVEQTLQCVSGATASALTALGHEVAVEDRALIALSKPVRFLSALAAAADPAHLRHAEAKGLLVGFVDTCSWSTSSPGQAPSPAPAPAAAADNPATEVDPVGQPNAAVPSHAPVGVDDPSTILVHSTSTAVRFHALARFEPAGCLPIERVRIIARRVDWEHATSVVFESRQIAACLAVLRRWRTAFRVVVPGDNGGQVFVLAQIGNRFRCSIQAAKDAARVPRLGVSLGRDEAFGRAVVLLQQLMLARPGMPANESLGYVLTIQSTDPCLSALWAAAPCQTQGFYGPCVPRLGDGSVTDGAQ
jgi:hypothetical protein